MNITQELEKRGAEYEIDDSGCILRIFDTEDNLGIMLQFDRFEMSYHFWDSNGCSYSPTRPFTALDEMFEQFLIYYGVDDPVVFEPCFKDWKPIPTDV